MAGAGIRNNFEIEANYEKKKVEKGRRDGQKKLEQSSHIRKDVDRQIERGHPRVAGLERGSGVKADHGNVSSSSHVTAGG